MAAMREQGTSLLTEFRKSTVEGNAVDLANRVIIGATLGAIVSSIVDDVFKLITGGVDFSNLFVVLSNPTDASALSLTAAKGAGVATLN